MKTQLESIDTRYGSDSHYGFSHGNTLPYTGLPFGMNYWVPQTTDQAGSWFFNPTLPIFQGIRLTHQPSPWIGDWSWLLLTPVSELPHQAGLFHRQSSYVLDQAVFQPHYLKIHSTRYQLTSHLTATSYGALYKMEQKQNQPISLFIHSQAGLTINQVDTYTISGLLEEKTPTTKKALQMFFHMKSDVPVERLEQVGDDWCLHFTSGQVELKIATSFLTAEQAKVNLPQQNFDGTKKAAKADWESYLHRFEIVEQGQADRRVFDHCLYRIFLFPQTFYEQDEKGQAWHRDLQTGAIRPGKLFTNLGFWDLFRTTFPLYSLILPDKYPDFLEGFLNSYRETGFLPKWLAPDERGMMPGTLIDGVLADACVKDIAPQLHEELLQAMLDTATKSDPQQIHGRRGMESYQQLGYIPNHYHESVSHTLDYAYSDFCIAQVAKKLGKTQLADKYNKQSQNYQHLFDPKTGYMRARDEQGQFRDTFSPYSWGQDYAECSAIQASLGVLHDIEGLKELMGGEQAFTNYLLQVCNSPAYFETTGYGYEIHEMSEMATAPFGQLAISNQPSFHIPYLFRYSRKPDYTGLIIKTLREQAFQPSFQAFPGDEDNGSLAAWYIWSALGLYPTCPGKADYDLGIPLFDHLKIFLPEKKKWLHIRSQHNHPHFQFVADCSLDGISKTSISHQELLEAEELDFTLSWLPTNQA